MKIIHTSDWHLGHRLYGLNRHEEQKGFLEWLILQVQEQEADALLIAGDIFDTHNPSAEATRLYYNFLTKLHQKLPHLQTVVIGGNHDSAARLDAPREVLKALNVHVIGALPNPNRPSWAELYCPINNAQGELLAWVISVPYLRASDLPMKSPNEDHAIINGVKEVYRLALDGLKNKLTSDIPIILTGHCEMQKSLLSLESERSFSGYAKQSLPSDVFTSMLQIKPTYVALGHLHLAQEVSNCNWIRYSGAPLPFSVAEKDYPHQLLCVEFSGSELQSVHPLFVPQDLKIQMMKIPKQNHKSESSLLPLSFDEVIAELKKLPELDDQVEDWKRPLIQVNVHSEHPDPNIKLRVIQVLKKKHPRLAKLTVSYPKKERQAVEGNSPKTFLSDIEPNEVFKSRWKSKRGVEPPSEQLALFEQLKDQAKLILEQTSTLSPNDKR